jgi:phosphoenolpyruvate carboxylase
MGSPSLGRIQRGEIRHLVGRLDKIILEQAGKTVFQHLDRVRRLSKRARHFGSETSRQTKHSLLDRLDASKAYQLAHAFSLFFQLVNLCEERERERRLKTKKAAPMSLRYLFRELKQANVTAKQLQDCLDELEIQPVLTAHPTDARRRTVINHIWRLTQEWEHPDEVLEALWQTEEIREQAIRPLQEVESTLYYFGRTIFETTANFYETFDNELRAHYPNVRRSRPFLTFASWVGGDRDGNPFVTPEVSRVASRRHHAVVMEFYINECVKLEQEITHSDADEELSIPHNPPPDAQLHQP